MNTSSMSVCRQDEWTALLLCAMKTSLSVAHELGLSPDAVLECAARHLKFRDFASFASAVHGASRAYGCCSRRDTISAVEVAYIKTLATRADNDRDVLACVPAMCCVPDSQNHLEAPDIAYEKVIATIQALKDDMRRTFSQCDAPGDGLVAGASGFARALTAIMPAEDNMTAYERAMKAILRIRFAMPCLHVDEHADDAEAHQDVRLTEPPAGWMQRVEGVVHQPVGLHN
ncbi:hypothetical protein PPMP20_24085 [Paraburkholderia phymatum]|uniref:Uncharacterized protein n=1 Tax=Paraburkholderia phymatum (strain DSM 17167 / CIP 108236 / LMG 21445 / STM815) TaxID=391038 RepID=B2JR19_PARP8|nr:hypothetical protein [Paraburkholderia phymatum]ACC73710.1 hypothetical protein Bphy_4600 [Paraburkholderia phymatum STM815]